MFGRIARKTTSADPKPPKWQIAKAHGVKAALLVFLHVYFYCIWGQQKVVGSVFTHRLSLAIDESILFDLVVFCFPAALFALAYGLSLPPEEKVQREHRARYFLYLFLFSSAVLLYQFLSTECLYPGNWTGDDYPRPLFPNSAGVCGKAMIAMPTMLIAVPLIVTFIFFSLGMLISRGDPVPYERRLSTTLRIFFVVSGLIFFGFGLSAVFSGEMAIDHDRHVGLWAVLRGLFFAACGVKLIVDAAKNRFPRWFANVRGR